jgi:hypothetical protein
MQPLSLRLWVTPRASASYAGVRTLVMGGGEKSYGTLQGVIMFPVLVSQAAAPFIAASLWQATGSHTLLQSVLLGMVIISALVFALAARLSRSRKQVANVSDTSRPG